MTKKKRGSGQVVQEYNGRAADIWWDFYQVKNEFQ